MDKDGYEYHWAQHLTREATEEETIEYWRERCKIAEDKLESERISKQILLKESE